MIQTVLPKIQTVLGVLEPERLGFCHSHEHLFLAEGFPATLNPDLCIDDIELTVEELQTFRTSGGQAIVDAQPLGCGRMERELAEASERTGVHIVASTGFHKLAFYPRDHWIRTMDEEELAELFKSELVRGMLTGTDKGHPASEQAVRLEAKAGLIKTAVDAERMADPDKKWFAAAAEAAKAAGAAIMCHTEGPDQALWLLDFYERRGIEPSRVILCHLDRRLERMDVNLELAGRGAYLEYDTIGRYKYHDDESEARWISAMLEAGHEDRLLLGLDTTRARLRSYGGGIGLTFLRNVFLPLLQAEGVTSAQMAKLMVHNPARAFAMDSMIQGA